MTASSRLVYIDNDCGGLVTETKDELCAALSEAIDTFTSNPQVPSGANRDSAISVGRQVFAQSGCTELQPDPAAND